MKRFVFFLLFLFFASTAHASLTSSQFASVLGTSVPNQLPKTFNILQTTNLTDFRSVHILSDGVELLRPVAETVSTRPQLLPAATRVAGSRVLLRKGVGLLGPVGVAVTVGMVGKDLYDLVKGSPSDYPLLNQAMTVPGFIDSAYLAEHPATYANGTTITGVPGIPSGKYFVITSYKNSLNGISGGCFPSASSTTIGLWKNVTGTSNGTCAIGVSPKNGDVGVYNGYLVSTAPASTVKSEDDFLTSIAPNDFVYDSLTTEIDKATSELSDAGKVATQPTTQQIKQLANDVQQDKAVDAAQEAVDSAQQNYDSNPTADALQALNEAKAALEAQKSAAARDNVVAPPVPDSGDYDSGIELPEKKSILSLLQSFASGSPIVSMLNSFTMSASGSGVVHLGDAYGKSIDVDFTRYESVLGGCGGVLLVLVHGFAVLTVVRGW